ncbi:MAG TPA: copper chaperone PCu(A)C [Candidatus Eisenbacteria bacterium]|nr:copper chaperone PCu(A)C [Candidatus Eisenbacteria bacterium]
MKSKQFVAKENDVRQLHRLIGTALLAMTPLLAQAGTPQVTASKPWIRYLLPSIPAGGYMVLQNSGDTAAVLIGASSPACGVVVLHQSGQSGGVQMMWDVKTIVVPAHGSVSFDPSGYHLMCMKPMMKVGDTVEVTLTFENGSSIAVTAPVYGASGAP